MTTQLHHGFGRHALPQTCLSVRALGSHHLLQACLNPASDCRIAAIEATIPLSSCMPSLKACCTDVAAYFPGCLERCDKQWEAFRHIAPGPYRRLNKNSFLLRGLESPWHDVPWFVLPCVWPSLPGPFDHHFPGPSLHVVCAGRGKSGLLTSLHAQSSARRPLQQAQTPLSPSLPKAARADPALVNFAISASREKQGSPLLRAESASEITVDGSLVQESAHVLQPAMAGELGSQPKGVR